MAPRAEAAPRRAAPLSRPGHLTPWATPPARQVDRPRAARRLRPAPPPVFVDDSGRRRRAGRVLGTCLAALVASYVAVVGLTFSGAPLIGRLAPPGVDELSRPAGDAGLDVGPAAQVSALPPAATADPAASGIADVDPTPADAPGPGETSDAGTTGAPAAATTTIATTTTTAPGRSTNSTVPTPGSTVPEHSTGGPPAEPPGKP